MFFFDILWNHLLSISIWCQLVYTCQSLYRLNGVYQPRASCIYATPVISKGAWRVYLSFMAYKSECAATSSLVACKSISFRSKYQAPLPEKSPFLTEKCTAFRMRQGRERHTRSNGVYESGRPILPAGDARSRYRAAPPAFPRQMTPSNTNHQSNTATLMPSVADFQLGTNKERPLNSRRAEAGVAVGMK